MIISYPFWFLLCLSHNLFSAVLELFSPIPFIYFVSSLIMAMPFIIHHFENIYSLDEQSRPDSVKPTQLPQRHSSKNHSHAVCEPSTTGCQRTKAQHATMGYAEVPLDRPEQYLRRGGGVKPRRPTVQPRSCAKQKLLPPLPKTGGDTGNKANGPTNSAPNACCPAANDGGNRATTAAKRAIAQRTVLFRPRYVDTKHGDSHDLKQSGLQPMYVYQPTFGKLPNYLIKRIRDAALSEEMFRDAQVRKQPLCRYVTQEERAELLGVSVDIKTYSTTLLQFRYTFQ